MTEKLHRIIRVRDLDKGELPKPFPLTNAPKRGARPMTFPSRIPEAAAACAAPFDESSSLPTIEIVVRPIGRRDFFSVSLGSETIVKSSPQPRCDAARVLHQRGFPDDALLVSRKEGSNVASMRGRLGAWRQLRVREDGKNSPRFVRFEPFPSARVSQSKAKASSPPDEKGGAQLNASSAPPGAGAPPRNPTESLPVADAPA